MQYFFEESISLLGVTALKVKQRVITSLRMYRTIQEPYRLKIMVIQNQSSIFELVKPVHHPKQKTIHIQ